MKKTTPKPARKPSAKQEKTASKRREPIPGAGNGGIEPPAEFRFKKDNKAAVGHGRPRTVSELRELVQELGNDTITEQGVTRLQAMLRSMFASKNSSDKESVLKYGWGTVPQQTQERTWVDDVIDLLVSGQVTDEQVQNEFPEHAETIIARAKLLRGPGSGTQAPGARPDAGGG